MTAAGPPPAGRIAAALAFFLGTWEIVYGAHRLITGGYPRAAGGIGEWAHWIVRWGWNPARFGPVFIVFGAAWLTVANLYLFRHTRGTWKAMLVLVVLSSWCVGPSSAILVAILALLLTPRAQAAVRASGRKRRPGVEPAARGRPTAQP